MNESSPKLTCSIHGTPYVPLGHWRLCPDCPLDAAVLEARFAPPGHVLIRRPTLDDRGRPAPSRAA